MLGGGILCNGDLIPLRIASRRTLSVPKSAHSEILVRGPLWRGKVRLALLWWRDWWIVTMVLARRFGDGGPRPMPFCDFLAAL